MRLKKRFMAIAILAILLSLISQATFAYFTAEEMVYNQIQMGEIDIQLNEYQDVGGQWKPYPAGPMAVMPDARISKIVNVTNLEMDAYIRIQCGITLKAADGKVMQLTADQISKLVQLDIDETDWKYVDGWWYYLHPLGTGETSKPFFTEVHFSPNMGNEFQQSTTEIAMVVQATQKANNGTDALTAAGWPAE